MSATDISRHEACHLLADACAVQWLAPKLYRDSEASWSISATAGEAVVIVSCDKAPVQAANTQIAALGAWGPAARVNWLAYVTPTGINTDLYGAAGLSPQDIRHIERADLRPLAVVRTLKSTQFLIEDLGESGFRRWSKMLWEASNQHLSRGWKLAELVPQAKAAEAVAAADQFLKETAT